MVTYALWNIPAQHNGVDCGVFLCAFAERISRRAGFNFHQANMSLFRWKMTWEILNSTVKEFIQVIDETTATKTTRKPSTQPRGVKKPSKQKMKEDSTEADSEGRKSQIQWPQGNSEEWRRLDTDLTMILREVGKTPEAKADLHPKIIYKFCLERFGEVEAKKKQGGKPSRRQTKGQKLRREINALKTAWNEAPEQEKDAINSLQKERVKELRLLKRAESIRARRKKQKFNTESFCKQPYSFARKVLDPEVKGNLSSTKEEVEEFLKKTHSDSRREEELGEIEGLYVYPEPQFEYQSSPPSLKEFQQVLKKARTKSSPGPNGVPYRLYKKCPGVARLLWNYIKGLWKRNKMSETWRKADGVLIPKEDGASKIEKFRTISLLNAEGKIFWKLKADKLTQYVMKNKYIDASIQKGGIPGVSGCLEHTAVLSHMIEEAKRKKQSLVSTWLDIANAYGSMAHVLINTALERAHVPQDVQEIVRSYYGKVEIRFTTKDFTTIWQQVEKGIVTGCTLSVILFALAMTMLLSSTKRETRGPVVAGQLQENARLYMDDVNTTTSTVIQSRYLLREISRFFSWARLTVKTEKCRVLVLEKGILKETSVFWNHEEITSIKKKPIKYLGKEYDHTLSESKQREQTVTTLTNGLKKIEKTFIAGKYKSWIVQNMLMPRLMWPLTIYGFPQTQVEEMESKITAKLKKWLGIPRSLSTSLLYSKSAVLQLPYTSLVEEVKAARARTQVMLDTSKDECVRNANISLDVGRKWKVTEAVETAKSKLRLQEIAGIANRGREGLGLTHREYYSKSNKEEKRRLIVQKVREEEEERRLVKIAGFSKQGRSLDWEVQKRVLKDADMRTTPAAQLQFSIKAIYDLLPTPQNKNLWYRTDVHCCHLCGEKGTLNHIMTGCKIALAQGRYTWRHNNVLRILGEYVDSKRKEINSLPWKKRSWIKFQKSGDQSKPAKPVMQDSFLGGARDWKIQIDLPGTPVIVPSHIAATS